MLHLRVYAVGEVGNRESRPYGSGREATPNPISLPSLLAPFCSCLGQRNPAAAASRVRSLRAGG